MYLKALVLILALTSATLLYLMVVELNPFIKRCNPDVCHDYALSAFKVHSVMHMGANHCDYGVLPGYLSFNVMKPVGERWQTASSKCRLSNMMAEGASTGAIKVMLFGDSVDAHMAQEWCILLQQPLLFTPTGLKGNIAAFAAAVKAKAAAAGGVDINTTASNTSDTSEEGCCKNRDVLYYCKPSDPAAANRISIGMFHLPGVHLDGPYHTGVKGNFLTRIPTALKTFNETFGGPPDLVILHSNFWDQTRMWEQQEPGYGQLNKLLSDVVFSYSSNFSLMLSSTKEHLPEDTLIATRTAAFPALKANWLGRWSYVHQLNMAALEVTRLHGLPVIDLGGMVFGLEPQQYLVDQHHPNKLVLLECANIALNLLAQQRKRLAQEGQGQVLPGRNQQQAASQAATDTEGETPAMDSTAAGTASRAQDAEATGQHSASAADSAEAAGAPQIAAQGSSNSSSSHSAEDQIQQPKQAVAEG